MTKNVWIKHHDHVDGNVLAACDADCLGKTLMDGKINFEIKERFYKGELVTEKELASAMQEATNMNLVGVACTQVAIKEGLLNEKDLKYIQGVPHAIVVCIQ